MEATFQPGALNTAAAYTIREQRKHRGLNQTQLGHRVGLTRRQIGKMETGDSVISLEEGIAIGLALGIEPRDFIELVYLQARSGHPPDYDARTRKLRSIWGID